MKTAKQILNIKTIKLVLNLWLFIIFGVFNSLYAQGTGVIKGKVFDKNTKEGLYGANVILIGTSLGAASDLDGNYIIRNVPEGNYTLEISYLGYNPKSATVTVINNRILYYDAELEYKVLEGKEVVVQAQAKGQLQAINQQLSSTGITNIVSSAKIQEVPDANAAESVGRLPGISIKRSSGEGNEIIVRGIQPRLNLITINNIRMPSTNENNTAVGLAGISQYMLSGIEVRKTLRAEDDADVVGGIVDLKLATAPEGLRGDVILEGMYNGLSKNLGSYRSSVHLSNRFLDNNLGVIAQVNFEKADRTNHALSAGFGRDTRETQNLGVYLTNGTFMKNEITRNRFGATVLLDYKLPKGKIQVNSIYNKFEEDRWERDYSFSVANANVDLSKAMRSIDGNNYTFINGLSLETEIFDIASLDVGASLTSGHRNGQTKGLGFYYNHSVDAPIAPEFTKNTYGKIAYDIIPYMRDTSSQYQISNLYIEDTEFKENESTFQANLKIPFNITSQFSGFVKLGGKARFKDRSYDYGQDGANGAIYGGDIDINQQIIDGNPEIPWPWKWANRPGGVTAVPAYPLYESGSEKILDDKVTIKEFSKRKWVDQLVDRAKAANWAGLSNWGYKPKDLANDYSGDEKLYAGYLMTELKWGKMLVLNAGVRYEKEETAYSGYGVFDVTRFENSLDTLKASKRTNEFFLPSATLRYNYSDWGDIRVAYSQSLARPEYYAIIPRYYTDISKSFQNAAGNTHLKPALSNNYDIILSFYGNYIGLFTIGGFYKEIENFFYQANFKVIDPVADNKLHEYNFIVPKGQYINVWRNLDKLSYINGLEVDWQANLWFLPSPLNGLVLGVNYTKIASRALYYTSSIKQEKSGPNPWDIHETRVDSFVQQSLIDQPNDIFNVSIGYDYKDFSMRVAFTFQGKTLTYKSNYIQTDGYRHDYSRLDLSVRQKLPLEGLAVQFLMSNITQEADKSYTYTQKYNNSEQYYGMTGSLGLRYEF